MKQRLRRLEVHAAAKINIGWRVGARREDGYHDVSGLIHTIDLVDRIEITTHDGDGFELSVPGFPELEAESNLVHAAARALREHADPVPTKVVVRKAIPVAAGLGGGSADAAATLVGLSSAWGARLSAADLVRLGASVGSDVPALLVGGLVSVEGRGERVRNVGAFDAGCLVLGVGTERVSTADAYRVFDELGGADPDSLYANDLERAACSLVDGLASRIEAMREAAGIAFVSGSGPTVVGVVPDGAHARGVAARVREHFADVLVARPTSWGVRLTLGT
jgi:4-diphosphocytidyl-2-C-methyl-D-erythritol kinase